VTNRLALLADTRPRLVELVGPAGAGKSTIAASLARDDGLFSGCVSLWGLPRRDLLTSAFDVAPAVASAAMALHPLRRSEIEQMVRVDALRTAVDRIVEHDDGVLLADEGPVFALAWFEVFFARNGDRGWSEWKRRVIREWARRLALVVYLDAPDDVLAARIRTRAKPHMVKDRSDGEIAAFATSFRQAFDRVLSLLGTTAGIPVVRWPIADRPPRDSAQHLRRAIERVLHGR
jgi:hypothetical protein